MDLQVSFDVFLSHSSSDKSRVRALAGRLKEQGLRVWFDEWSIAPGEDIYMAVERGLQQAHTLVLCLSPAALGSEWVELERSTALFRNPSNSQRRFLPILLATCTLPDSLRRYRYVDLRVETESAIQQVVAACRGRPSGQGSAASLADRFASDIERAKKSTKKRDEADALRLWAELREVAEQAGDQVVAVRADLESAFASLKFGYDVEDVLETLRRCIREAGSLDLGEHRTRLLQLLGEAHRLNEDLDQARGFLQASLAHSRTLGSQCDEGWALLSLSQVEQASSSEPVSGPGLEIVKQAYQCFSALYATGDTDAQYKAQEGFAAAHSCRARLYGRMRTQDALAEYVRAVRVLEDLGADYEWDLANVMFERGDLYARSGEPQHAGRDYIGAAKHFEALGDTRMQAKCSLAIAELLDQVGHRKKSMAYYNAAVALLPVEVRDSRSGWIWFRYGCKLLEMHEVERGVTILEQLLDATWLRPGSRLDVLKMLSMALKGDMSDERRDRYASAARDLIDEQIARATSGKERRRLLVSKGHTLQDLDDVAGAIDCYHRARKEFETLGDAEGVVMCWQSIASASAQAGRSGDERAAYERILALAPEAGAQFEYPLALTMLAQLELREGHLEAGVTRLDEAEVANERLRNPAVALLVHDLRRRLAGGEFGKNGSAEHERGRGCLT